MKKLAQYLLMLLLLACFVNGENITEINDNQTSVINETINDNASVNENITQPSFKLEIVIQETLFVGVVYDSLFKITNLNKTPGTDNYAFVIVKYNVTKRGTNSSLVIEDYFNKTINYYSSSDTGRLFLEERGNYTLCGNILNTTISACKDFDVLNPLTIPCSIELNLSTDKEIYNKGESVDIKNSMSNQTFPYIIQYWVEDLFGSIVKEKQNTSNTNLKSFTPKINEKDKVFLAKNVLIFVGCNNSNSHISNEKMIISLNKDYEPEKEKKAEETTTKKSASTKTSSSKNSSTKKTALEESAKILSFYTRNKKYNQSINLYANIKASKSYSLALLSSKGEQKIGFNGSNNIKFRVEPAEGANLFILKLIKDNKMVDSKELFVKLEGSKVVKANRTIAITAKTNKTITATSRANNTVAVKKLSSVKNNSYERKNTTKEPVNDIISGVVYESSSLKVQKYIPFILIGLGVLVVIGLVLLRKR